VEYRRVGGNPSGANASARRLPRALAILHAAIYDAVNGITRTHEPFFVTSAVPASASPERAASAAAHRVLTTLFADRIEAFDALHTRMLSAIANGPLQMRGVAWGNSVADQILGWRATDNSETPIQLPASTGPGAWVPTPPAFAPYLLPQWGGVTPFAMLTNVMCYPAGPPALASEAYAADYNQVKAYGASVNSFRTPEQDLMALFWADGAGTETPAGHWNHIAQDVAAVMGNTVEENARLFALLNIAMADAAICAWDAKYLFDYWRPITAIRNGDQDGNPATDADPTWTPFISTPPFPEYVSGHSTFSAAAARILARFYGTDRISFTTGSDFLTGVLHRFTSFSEAATEAALSRLYGGIHFMSAIQDGLTSGSEIGDWTFTHVMQPKGNRSRK
jgi:hypothetical protein